MRTPLTSFVIPSEDFSPSRGTCFGTVPTGLRSFTHVHPALKRWAKLFRLRAGSCVAATNVPHCGIQALALPVILSGGGPLSAAGVEGPLLRTLTVVRSLSHTVRLTPAPQPHSAPASGSPDFPLRQQSPATVARSLAPGTRTARRRSVLCWRRSQPR